MMEPTAKIVLEIPSKGLRPFGQLSGKVRWLAQSVPKGLELRMFWATRGRGTEELSVVKSLEIEPLKCGEIGFHFELPRKPYSFSGKLVSVVWALELVDSDGTGLAIEEFILTPTGEEWLLGEVQNPRSERSKGRWRSRLR